MLAQVALLGRVEVGVATVRVGARRGPGMHGAGLGHLAVSPAQSVGAVGPVGLLGVQEERLVELSYLLEGFGPLPAFLFGWSELTVIRASALGAIATIFAEYLGYFVELRPEQVRWTAAAAVLVIGLLNYLGVRSASRFMNLITALKYGSLAGLALLAFTSPSGTLAHFTPAWSGGLDLSLLATALIAIMWTYDGWADLSFMGGEVRDPGRTLPMALILGTTGIVLVYLLLNEAALAVAEGVVRSPRDGDIGAIFGFGYPPFRGGPLRTIDALGPDQVVRTLEELARDHGPRFLPCEPLRQLAQSGSRYYPA